MWSGRLYWVEEEEGRRSVMEEERSEGENRGVKLCFCCNERAARMCSFVRGV